MVTMLETLRRRLAGTPAKAPDPQTRIVGGGSDKNPFTRLGFGAEGQRRTNLKKYREIYRKGGPVADAIDAYPLFTLTNGWQLVCEDGKEGQKDRVQMWMDQPQIDFDAIMWQGIIDAMVCGTAFQEIVPDRAGDLWGVLPRDASSFTIQYDDHGRITGYTQAYADTMGIETQQKQIDADRILTLTLLPIPGDVYGVSVIGRAYDDIMRDCDIVESLTKAMHRHGTPKQQWRVGSDDNRASTADLKDVENEIEQIDAKTDFVTTHDVEITALDTTGIVGATDFSNLSLQRLSCALGVPEEMLGLGRGSTEATATVRMRAFLDKISTIQEIVARTYSRQVIDRITQEPGAVWIEFNDVSPEDEAAKAAWITNVMKATPLDPFSVVPQEWIREQFGISDVAEIPANEALDGVQEIENN